MHLVTSPEATVTTVRQALRARLARACRKPSPGREPGQAMAGLLPFLRRRRLRARPRRLRWLGVVCLVVIGLLYYRPLHSYLHARRQLSARTAEVSQLMAQKRELQEQLAATTNSATLVQAARRIGLVRPGERLFIVKDIPAWRRAHRR